MGMEVIETRDLGQRDGFDLIAYKVVDPENWFEGEECYEEADAAAHSEGTWFYTGVIVKAFREDIEMGEDSIWRVEEGYSPGFVHPEHRPSGIANAFDHTLGGEGCYDLPDNALIAAKKVLAKLLQDERRGRRRWPRRVRVACW